MMFYNNLKQLYMLASLYFIHSTPHGGPLYNFISPPPTQPSSRRFLGAMHFAKKRREAPGSAGKFCRAGKRREVLIYFDASRQIYHFAKKPLEVPTCMHIQFTYIIIQFFGASRQIYHFVKKRREAPGSAGKCREAPGSANMQIAPKKRRELGCV